LIERWPRGARQTRKRLLAEGDFRRRRALAELCAEVNNAANHPPVRWDEQHVQQPVPEPVDLLGQHLGDQPVDVRVPLSQPVQLIPAQDQGLGRFDRGDRGGATQGSVREPTLPMS
jgi:hypothetical protein